MATDRVSLQTLQWRLLTGWGVVVALCTVFFLVAGELTRAFPGQQAATWGWFAATLIPPLALAAGAVVDNERSPSAQTVSKRFALAASLVVGAYGVLVLFTAMGHGAPSNLSDWFTKSGFWLGPTQGVANLFLASVFPRRSTEPAAERGKALPEASP